MFEKLFKKPQPIPKHVLTKIAIGAVICVVLISTIYVGKVPYGGQPQVGDIANRTIYAPFNFSYYAGTDLEKTEELRSIASSSVKDLYDIDINLYSNATQNIKSLFATLKDLKGVEEISLDNKVARLKAVEKLNLTDGTLRALLQGEDINDAETDIIRKVSEFFNQGIISQEEKESLRKRGKDAVAIRNLNTQVESVTEVENLKTPDGLKQQLESTYEESFSGNRRLKTVILEITTKTLAPNLKFNETETLSRREKAVAAVPIQKKSIDVKRNELIISKGERLTPIHVAKLEALRFASLEEQRLAISFLGIGLVVFALITIASFYFAYYDPEIFSNNRHLLSI